MARKIDPMLEPVVNAFKQLFTRAIEAAAEAALDDLQDRAQSAVRKISVAKSKVKSRTHKPKEDDNTIEVEAVEEPPRRH